MRRLWIAALLVGCITALAVAGEESPREDPLASAAARLTTASIEDLHRAMMSGDALERCAAATVAGRRTTESAEVFDELVAATGDDVAAVRLAATRALGEAGRIEAACVQRLARLAEHATDAAQRRAAAAALVRISPSLEASQRLMIDPTGRALVFAGLTDLGPGGAADLLVLAESEEWRTRAASAAALAAVDPGSTKVRGAIERLMRDESAAVRAEALEVVPKILGSGLISVTDVERAFSDEGTLRERLLLIVALVGDGSPEAPTKPHVRAAALAAAVASGGYEETTFALRMAHAVDLHSESALLSLARVACAPGGVRAREAASALFQAARQGPLPRAVADALRPALSDETPHYVAATAALALARGGHDGPELAAPAARMLVTYGWPTWSEGPMRHAPTRSHREARRNLRAGGGGWGHGVSALPRVPSPGAEDVMPILARHPEPATAPLAALCLTHDAVATRAVAAWALGVVRNDDAKAGELLRPLLDDRALAVRVVGAYRLARVAEHADLAVRSAVAMLLADEAGQIEDPVIVDAREDGALDEGGAIEWVDELVASLPRSPRAAIDALVAVRARSTETIDAIRIDRETGKSERSQELGWTWLPGERHVVPMLEAIGEPAAELLVEHVVEDGETRSRLAALWLLQHVPAPSAEVNERLGSLTADPEIGDEVRRCLGR